MSRKPSIFLNMFHPHIYIDIYTQATRAGLLCVSYASFLAKKTIVSYARQ